MGTQKLDLPDPNGPNELWTPENWRALEIYGEGRGRAEVHVASEKQVEAKAGKEISSTSATPIEPVGKRKKGKGRKAPIPPATSQRLAMPPPPTRSPTPPSESEYDTDELHRQQHARGFPEFEIATGRGPDSRDYTRWEEEADK